MQPSASGFSVIIVNYAGEDVLEACVRSVVEGARPPLLREVILADNASGDAATERAAALSPLVRVLRLPRNIGYGAAVNEAAKGAAGRYLVALNNDTRLPPGCLEEFEALFKRRGERLLACPLLVYASDPGRINSAGTYLTPLGTTGAYLKGEDASSLDPETEVPAPTGACLVASKAFFDELGGFDEECFLYCEDLDLGWRARRAGAPVILLSRVRVEHRTAGARKESVRYYELTTRNRLYVIRKNAEGLERLGLLIAGSVTAIGTAFLLAAGGSAPLGTTLRAVQQGLSMPVKSPAKEGAQEAPFRRLSWSETLRHLLRQGQSHLS